MSVNNEMYLLFNKMMEGYKNQRYDAVENAAHCWLMFNPENPFKQDTQEYEVFFQMQRCFTIWRNGDINARINRKRMVEYAKQLCSLDPAQPYKYNKSEEERERKQAKEAEKQAEKAKEQEKEPTKEEKQEDINSLLDDMTKAYKESNENDYEMYALHLVDVVEYNPFILGTDEYELFSTMKTCYAHRPQNLKRLFAAGKELCSLLLGEDKTEKQTVLGVIPNEKKNWLKFLFPWRKEGEIDDSSGTN